ncbi:MAG: hypothetical protein MZV63_07695 [Marinilabiliales bacterium]|nr:hypothetical protein [Marinilabiliales bacterium]
MELTEITNILNEFEPIGLDGMAGVRYMSRVDTKYPFSVSKLPLLLRSTRSLYQCP